MNPHQILMTVIRLVAIVWILYSISHTYSLLDFINSPPQSEFYTPVMNKTSIASFLILKILIGIVLWVFAFIIARKLLPPNFAYQETSTISIEQWQTLGLVLIGVWGLTSAIPDAYYWLKINDFNKSYGSTFDELSHESKVSVVATIMELIICFFLIFGSRALTNIIRIIRYGVNK